VVEGDRDYPRADPKVLRSLGRGRDEDFRRTHKFEPARVVLAYPQLIEAEAI
jgi:hypothetical protein